MPEGIIVKGYSGFYYVQAGEQLWECSLRGRFRLHTQDFLPGDRVIISPLKGTKGVIEEVMPRANSLARPPVANVEQVIVVFAAVSPQPDLNLLDRILIQAEAAGVNPVVCLNKADLALSPEIPALVETYQRVGYGVMMVSAKSGRGVGELRQALKGKTSVFAGPSGVGKSSLLNAVHPGLQLRTGEVSAKLRRGRHTTRHVELIPLEGSGLVADTPGFSALDLPPMQRQELTRFFPEILELAPQCKFSTCLHRLEPQCAVKAAVERGMIDNRRYENYLTFLTEVIEQERRF